MDVTNKRYSHAVVYLGAPYGDNEGGHVVSLHTTRKTAERALDRMGELKAREHTVVELDSTKPSRRWVFGTVKTPREYFALG